MKLQIIKCDCGHEFATRKDPKSEKKIQKPQCVMCGNRITK